MPWVPPSPMAHFGLAWASRVHTLASAWASRVHTLASAWAAVCTLWPRHGQPCAHFGLGMGSRVHTLALAWASRVHTLALAWASRVHILALAWADFGLGVLILALAVQRWPPKKKKKKICSEFAQILHGCLLPHSKHFWKISFENSQK